MAGIVVADAGPLIAFASIDALCVLQNLFSEISIAESVKRECLCKPGPDSQRIETAIDEGWLVVFPPGAATEPLFLERIVDGKTYTIVDEWCEGYMRGVALAAEQWELESGRYASDPPLNQSVRAMTRKWDIACKDFP